MTPNNRFQATPSRCALGRAGTCAFGGAKVAYLPTDRDLGVIIETFSGTPGAEQEQDAT